jgi:hypothetical protein
MDRVWMFMTYAGVPLIDKCTIQPMRDWQDVVWQGKEREMTLGAYSEIWHRQWGTVQW